MHNDLLGNQKKLKEPNYQSHSTTCCFFLFLIISYQTKLFWVN
jgi:hypothetical protein